MPYIYRRRTYTWNIIGIYRLYHDTSSGFQMSHPRVGAGPGNHDASPSRGLCAVGLAIPPPTPTPAHWTHCPPFGRFAASAFGASACQSRCGAARLRLQVRLRRISVPTVPPDLSGPLPGVHSPLQLSDSALCSARCLPARSTC